MPTIYIDTDNSNPDPAKKLYKATLAGGAADRAERIMQSTIRKTLVAIPDFVTDPVKNPKGYAIRLSVAKVEVVGADTKCELSGSIVRYPPEGTMKRGEGEVMVSTKMTGSATASGKPPRAVVDCVEAITEDLVRKSVDAMRRDFAKR